MISIRVRMITTPTPAVSVASPAFPISMARAPCSSRRWRVTADIYDIPLDGSQPTIELYTSNYLASQLGVMG